MATYSQMETTQLVKEVLVYRQVTEYLKTYEWVASEATRRHVIASGFGRIPENVRMGGIRSNKTSRNSKRFWPGKGRFQNSSIHGERNGIERSR